MAISYSDFLTQVRNFTEVDSNVLSDTIIGQFIRNVELDVAGKVDYDDTRKYATSSFTADKRFLVTPADFLVIRSLQVFADTNITSARTFMEKETLVLYQNTMVLEVQDNLNTMLIGTMLQ